MPVDPTNMPFERPSARGTTDETFTGGGAQFDTTLRLESMLLEEFNYAGVTAYQAYEDRARIFNLYLLLIGVVASAIGAIYQIGKPDSGGGGGLQGLVFVLLSAGAILGFFFFAKLIRLRQAHRDSILTMNTIKEFYISKFHGQIPEVEHVFRWRLHTTPAGERLGSVTFLVCYTTAFLGSMCAAGASFVAYSAQADPALVSTLPFNRTIQALVIATTIAFVWLVAHILVYVRMLSKRRDKAAIAAAAHEVEKSGVYKAH